MKRLIAYLSTGPTFKERVLLNLKNFDSFKYFDVLVITDDVDYFKDVKVKTVDLQKIMSERTEFNKFEILAEEKREEEIYKRQIIELSRKLGTRYPLHLQRYAFTLEDIHDYDIVILCDCDMVPIFSDESIYIFDEYTKNEMAENSVSSNRAYYTFNKERNLEIVNNFRRTLIKDAVNYPIESFDGPVKIFKFKDKESIENLFSVWDSLLLNLFQKSDPIIGGSWNILSEELLAIIYKVLDFKVNNSQKDYLNCSGIKSFTYPEDRFWEDCTHNNFNTDTESKKEFIKKNFEKLKIFYESRSQDFHYFNTIVTLTTLPSRLAYEGSQGIKACIKSLLDQNTEFPYEIHINIPSVNKKTGEVYIVPEWLKEAEKNNSKLKLFTELEDVGSITKLYYTINRLTNPEDIIIVCDDDLIYHPNMVQEQISNQHKFVGCAVGYDGIRAEYPIFNDVRDHYVVSVPQNVEVNYLQHYKTVSYKRKYFEEDFFSDEFMKISWADDIVLGAYMGKRNIKKIVTFYEKEDPINSLEDWQKRGGVTTFPCIAHTVHENKEGCNIFRQENIDDNMSIFVKKGYLK